jgi:hypothetical protein
VHQDGIGGRGRPIERCRFLPGPSEIRRCAGRSERQGFCRWRRCGGGRTVAAARTAGGRAAIMAVIAMSRFRRPDFAMGGPHGGAPRGPIAGGLHGGGALHFAMGGPHRGGGPHGTAAPRNAVSPWEAGAPRSAASANPWLGAIARCSRTGSSNPSPSSGESDANLTSSNRCEDESRHRPTMLLACLYVPCSADERGPG